MSNSLPQIKNRSQTTSIKKLLKNKKKQARLILLSVGIGLILLASFFDKIYKPQTNKINEAQKKVQPTLVSGVQTFASEPVKVDESLTEKRSQTNNGNQPVRIIIPKLSVDLAVKKAPVVNGYWQVFEDVAGWGEGSAQASDDSGNQVIFAHAREGLFLSLRNIENDQLIYILTDNKWYKYKVVEIKQVLPSNTEVIAATEDKTLTLYTCSGFADRKRLIVVAKPME